MVTITTIVYNKNIVALADSWWRDGEKYVYSVRPEDVEQAFRLCGVI